MARALVAGALALALLGAWRESLLHPLEHLDGHGRFVHLAGADGSDARGENDDHGDPSDRLGEVVAALAACLAGAAPPPRPVSGAHGSPRQLPRYALRAADAPPFLAQAPPSCRGTPRNVILSNPQEAT